MERLLNITELSNLLNVKQSTIYDWVHMNFIPHYKLGKLVRFNESEILKWLENRKKCGRVNRIPKTELISGKLQ